MKINYLIIALSFYSQFLFSQELFSGRIVDEKHHPVNGVFIINLSNKGSFTFSDSLGRYSLPVRDVDTLRFEHLAYVDIEVPIQKMEKNHTLKLDLNSIFLNEVEIVYENANALLMKSIRRLKQKLLLNKEVLYTWYGNIKFSNSSYTIQEGTAQYSSYLKKYDGSNSKIPYDLRLIQLKTHSDSASYFYDQEKRNLNFEYHLLGFYENRINKNYIVTLDDTQNENLIYITCKPKKEMGKLISYVINKRDSVLTAVTVKSIDLNVKSNKKNKVLQIQSTLHFKEHEEMYFMSECFSAWKCYFSKNGEDRIVDCVFRTKSMPFENSKSKNGIKLNGFTKQLFNIKNY